MNFGKKLDLHKTDETTQIDLCGVGGPDESVESKYQQLCLHERLHQFYIRKGNTKTAMSHYLEVMAKTRQRQMKQLEFILNSKDDIVVNKNEIGLEKIPKGKGEVIRARVTSYPNLNNKSDPYAHHVNSWNLGCDNLCKPLHLPAKDNNFKGKENPNDSYSHARKRTRGMTKDDL